jgi:hypothetical protein
MNMHLDPDFKHLTYGDNGERRGKEMSSLGKGDFLVFYASLKPMKPCNQKLVYALIGFYEVEKILPSNKIPEEKLVENAHTRKISVYVGDVVVFGNPNTSGRFRNCIPIGEYRNGAYRVKKSVLEEWGELGINDGFIQRNRNPPFFLNPNQLKLWLKKKNPKIIQNNFD